MAKKVGVLLSGCGVFDDAEIHESEKLPKKSGNQNLFSLHI